MQRLGHSTVSAASAYQHAAEGSDKRIAAELSQIVLRVAGGAQATHSVDSGSTFGLIQDELL